MIIYWSVCLLSISLAYLGTHTRGFFNGNHRVAVRTAIVSALPLFFLSAFRYGIGTDYFSYVEIYQIWIPRSNFITIEPLYYYLNKAIYHFAGNDYQWLFIVCSVLYIYFVFKSIFKMSVNPAFSIFLLFSMSFYLSSFNTMREHIGCAILLYALSYFEKKDIKRFIFFVIVATGFHYSCALFGFVILLRLIKFSPKRVAWWSAIFIALQGLIIQLVNRLFGNSIKYSNYLRQAETHSINSILGLLIQVIILLFLAYLYQRNRDDEKYNYYFGIQTLAVWLNIVCLAMPSISRIKWVFSLPAIIILPYAINSLDNRSTRLLLSFVVCALFSIYLIIVVGFIKSFGVIPYRSIFVK